MAFQRQGQVEFCRSRLANLRRKRREEKVGRGGHRRGRAGREGREEVGIPLTGAE